MICRSTDFLLSVDPGTELGWAWWERKYPQRPLQLMDFGVISSNIRAGEGENPDSWLSRMLNVAAEFRDLIIDLSQKVPAGLEADPAEIVMECPSFFESFGGQTTASSGSLVKLAMAAGAEMAAINCIPPDRCFIRSLVTVNAWKGQMSKEAVQHRIRKVMNLGNPKGDRCEKFRSHVWDAVGIGLYWQGRFG